MKLIETFPGVWLSPTDIKTIYVLCKLDHIKENKKVFKYCATIKTGEETFYGDEFDTPEEQEYERLYRKNKLVIDGVPIRWGESPCFTWCTKSNTPACKKFFRQRSLFD